ncbi:MAG: hypothetical protein CL908_25655 [Deltaproteobacteria bacterium]|nr:hypothetical protein [Deltaproteobacteria bacterium]
MGSPSWRPPASRPLELESVILLACREDFNCFQQRGMASSPRHDRSSAKNGGETRASLLAVAERHFAAAGFDAARMEDVAAEVGIKRAGIFYYFRDKRALYDAVLTQVFEQFMQRSRMATQAASNEPASPTAQIRAARRPFRGGQACSPLDRFPGSRCRRRRAHRRAPSRVLQSLPLHQRHRRIHHLLRLGHLRHDPRPALPCPSERLD